jgi:hypothetical protein
MAMCFEYDYQRNYTTTITRAVGPTTLVGARGTLPQPAPDDTNAIWLAPNGNDANPGTQASPKLTLAGANAALTAGKPTIHIFRNGFVGDLVFSQSLGNTLAASRNIQAEEGEIGIIEYTTGGSLGLNSNCKLNGLEIRNTESHSLGVGNPYGALVETVTHSNITISNCKIITKTTGRAIFITPTTANSLFEYTHFAGNGALIVANTTITVTINNCIFQRYANYPNLTLPLMEIQNSTTDQHTLNITRSIFEGAVGGTNPVIDIAYLGRDAVNSVLTVTVGNSTSIAPGLIYNFDGCVFINTNYTLAILDNSTPAAPFVTAEYNYCLDLSNNGILAQWNNSATATNANFVFNNLFAISPGTPPLYTDFAGASTSKNTDLFRLQTLGKSTPDGTGRYFINSPLIDAYDTGSGLEDVNPWDESTSFVDATFGQTLEVDWPPSSANIPTQPQNPISMLDVRGNLHQDYDAYKRLFQFTYGDATHISNLLLRRLTHMLQDKGSKRWYPIGIGANVYTSGGAGTLPATFSNADSSVTPEASDVMVDNHWRGFWMTIGAGEFYIESNDNEKIYLADKKGDGFPSDGPIQFSIQFMLLQNEPTEIVIKQQNFTQFMKGGSLANDDTEVRNYDYTLEGFTMKEVEDFEENL